VRRKERVREGKRKKKNRDAERKMKAA